ncbi:MAG: hypothetical protein KGL39_40650 [Patescibacteria group bacterium]|nr:hypothetical protein [Patescibacteria group bacterium]
MADIEPNHRGGLYTGAGTTIPGLNIEFWAQITSYDGSKWYGWQEVIPWNGSFVVKDGGRKGTTTVNPAYEANQNEIPLNSYVKIKRAYFDGSGAGMDWVYVVVLCATGGSVLITLVTKACPIYGPVDMGEI